MRIVMTHVCYLNYTAYLKLLTCIIVQYCCALNEISASVGITFRNAPVVKIRSFFDLVMVFLSS